MIHIWQTEEFPSGSLEPLRLCFSDEDRMFPVQKYNLFLAEESEETSLLGSVQGGEVKRARHHRVRNEESNHLGNVQSGFGTRLVRIVVELSIPAAQLHDRPVSVA